MKNVLRSASLHIAINIIAQIARIVITKTFGTLMLDAKVNLAQIVINAIKLKMGRARNSVLAAGAVITVCAATQRLQRRNAEGLNARRIKSVNRSNAIKKDYARKESANMIMRAIKINAIYPFA